jgi:hypothetical protein
VNIARFPVTTVALKAAGAVPIFLSIMTAAEGYTSASNSLQSVFALMFLTGKDEGQSETNQFMSLKPDAVDMLLNVLRHYLKGEPIAKVLIIFSLKLLIQACLCLATSDSKRDALVQTDLLNILKQILDLFIYDRAYLKIPPELVIGGGGKDVESAELAIATLTQLSFAFDSDHDLQEQYMKPSTGILQQMVSLSTNQNLSAEARQNANILKTRLTFREIVHVVAEPVTPPPIELSSHNSSNQAVATHTAPPARKSHIMISYCWAKEAKPEFVKGITREFKQMGYDVWRDEVSYLIHVVLV